MCSFISFLIIFPCWFVRKTHFPSLDLKLAHYVSTFPLNLFWCDRRQSFSPSMFHHLPRSNFILLISKKQKAKITPLSDHNLHHFTNIIFIYNNKRFISCVHIDYCIEKVKSIKYSTETPTMNHYMKNSEMYLLLLLSHEQIQMK